MNRSIRAVTAAGLILTASLSAESCCDSWFDGIQVGVDVLVWNPCSDDLDCAITSDADVTGPTVPVTAIIHRRCLDLQWEPGVRAYFKKSGVWCNWDLQSSYTYIHPTEGKHYEVVTGGTLQPVAWAHGGLSASNYGSIHANVAITYHAFDLLFSKQLCCNNCYSFTPFFGLESLWFNDLRHFKGLTGARTTTRKFDSDLWGFGLKAGSEVDFTICEGLHFFTKGSLTLLTGHHSYQDNYRDDNNQTITNLNIRGKNDGCICVPGYHIALGFEYHPCWCGYDVGLKMGYEFVQWMNMPSLPRYTSQSVNQRLQTPKRYDSVWGFQGLTVGLNYSF